MKKAVSLFLALCALFSLSACGKKPAPTARPKAAIRIGVLKGPTGVGAAYLMEQAAEGKSANDYDFYAAAAPTDIMSRLVSGELDMAALPTNVAAALYKRTGGNVRVIALNTLGVLYILQNGEQLSSLAALRGKTLYATGQGSNPEYVLNYILRQNGLDPEKDLTIVYKDSAELSTLMAAGSIELCMLPVPAATSVMLKNSAVTTAIDLTEEWSKVSGSTLTMGCVVLRRDAGIPASAVDAFLEEYAASIKYVNENIAEAAELVAKYEITGSAAVAAAAIADCNLVCITGAAIRPAIEGYYQVLFDADPTSIGGSVPDEEFYPQPASKAG